MQVSKGAVSMTSFLKIRPLAGLSGLLIAGLMLFPLRALGQETTGSVSGLVQDATGAAIPKATVVLTNLQNKSQRKALSSDSGNFAMASIQSGLQYQITVTTPGFKKWESKPFPVGPGDRIAFTDIKLQVGEVQAQVTVEAMDTQAIKPLDTPERSDTITAKDLETLAIEGRDAEELIEMLPGFAMISPGVNNVSPANNAVVGVNSGTSGAYSANGAGPTGLATVVDGVSLTNIQTNAGTVQTVNADMIEDAKVSTSTFSAVNAKGPAVFNATTKHGSASYHGQAYFYVRDTVLNSNDWYNNYLQQSRPPGRYLYPGGQFGGPLWIPGTRFTRHNDKLFFFFGYEYANQNFSPETLGAWVPTMAERSGDFSVASLNAQLCGARPDGRANPNVNYAMCNGENYTAAGHAIDNGQVQQYVDPNGAALLNWLPLPNANPFTNLSGYNYVQAVVQQQNVTQLHARIDYTINDRNSVYVSYGREAQVTQDPVSLNYIPNDSTLYPGGVTTGDISNILSATYTRVLTSNLTNELNGAFSLISDPANMGNPAAVDRFDMNKYNCTNPAQRASGTCTNPVSDNFNYLGEYKNAGDYSVPALADYSELGYSNVQMPGGFYNNQLHTKQVVPDVRDTISWLKGPHFFQFGVYYEKGIINGNALTNAYPQGEYTFNPGSGFYEYSSDVGQAAAFVGCQSPETGPNGGQRLSGAAYLGECINPNAMMYMGTPDSFTQANFTPVVDMQYTTLAGFVNDQWKLHRLTLMLGARVEHLGPWVDRHDNGLATFSPALYNQECSGRNCGATNFPGITWHSQTSSVANSVNNPAMVYFTPRVGLSWDILGHGNTVLHGGWGIYRHEEEFAPYAAAAATAQGYKQTYINQGLTFAEVDAQSPIAPPDFTAYTISPTDTVRPVYYEYNATISQRVNWRWLKDSLVEIAYVGSDNRNQSSFNQQASGYNEASDINLIPAGFMFQQAPAFSLGVLPATLSNSGGNSISDLTTAGQDFYRPFPFYNHIYTLAHDFYSNYNSMQASFNKSSGHVQFGANYSFSKALATAAGYVNNIPDPINLRNDYNPAPFDRTQVVNAHYLIDIGKPYHGENHLLSGISNGWQVSGFSTLMSGPDLSVQEGGNFGFGYGSIAPVQLATGQQRIPTIDPQCATTYNIPADANGDHYCTNNMNPSVWLGTPDYQLMPTVLCNPAGGSGTHQYINANCLGVPLPGSPSTGQYALSKNPSGQGQYRMPYIHGPYYQNHNVSVLKNIGMGGEKRIQLRAEAFNPFNHPQVSFNNNSTTNLSLAFSSSNGAGNLPTAGKALSATELASPQFGIANIKYGSRLIELGAKFFF